MKLSDLTPEQWYARLNTKRLRQAEEAKKWWQYVDLEQPLYYVARVLAEQDDRFPPLLIAWPELVLDSIEERLDIEGFRLAGQDSANDELRKAWQANDLDEGSGEAHMAALAASEAFIMVGPGDGDFPLQTVEYSDQVAVEIDPRTRQPVASLKVYSEDTGDGSSVERAVLLRWDRSFVEFENGQPVDSGELGDWMKAVQASPLMPQVPVVPMLNRPRRGVGRSELVALKPLVDAANQTATNLMAGIEHHALGRKWALGVSEKDFVDENGNPVPLWKAATGAVWAVPPIEGDNGEPVDVKLGQFSASDLRNFHESFKMMATIAASVYGLPPDYMGYTSSNPVSAEAIRYSLDRLIKRAERRQRTFGGAWERAQRMVWAMLGHDPADAIGLESVWRDASTPTRASMADATQKLLAVGAIDREQAWEDLQYTEQQKQGMRQRMAAQFSPSAIAAAVKTAATTGTSPGITPVVTGAPAAGG